MELSLRGGGGEPFVKPVRLSHCKGGTGISVLMGDCAAADPMKQKRVPNMSRHGIALDMMNEVNPCGVATDDYQGTVDVEVRRRAPSREV